MKLTFAQQSSMGPRPNNEDWVGHWEPQDEEERLTRGAVLALADGVGGHGDGEQASQLAVEVALRRFLEVKPETPPKQVLWKMITAANVAVYDRGMSMRGQGRMATTLTISIFRNNELNVGHVGDCRVYLIQSGHIEQVTADHNYAASQVKMGLLSPLEAATSDMRCVLTRSIGKEPTVQVDFYTRTVNRGDYFVQCSDGLYTCITDEEFLEIVTHATPPEACKQLIELAERRGTSDNLSVQVAAIEGVTQVRYYRGLPIYDDPPEAISETELGQVLDERFELLSVISRSGMASIFKAKDRKTGEMVAVKVPFMQFESDPAFFSRFQREEEIGKLLQHPNILRFISVDGKKSRPYIAMELLEGKTLRQVMRSYGVVPVADALMIAIQICDALAYMHEKGIVHRDLKPENIMLLKGGGLRIMDFGIAKAEGMRRLTFAGFSPSMGTPDYMAPEQVKGKRGDARTDIYSLGAMLYEMVTGSPPFDGANPYLIMNARLGGDPIAPRKRNKELSLQVEEIILHAMEQDPDNRYTSAAEMKADLDAPEKVPLTGRHERLRPPMVWKTKWRTLRMIIIAALVPIVVFGLMYLFYRHPWTKH
ncbi:MAG TPA: protein kinase [Pirellulales bacterium]|jgi:serine/threonine-protein kinase|nr:protein kinase [Pirellulales bacterium]